MNWEWKMENGEPAEPLLEAALSHLCVLVACDTRNPPRAIDGTIFDYIESVLPGFHCERTDYGDGAITLHAVRGTPSLLFNVHLDTVPRSPAWSRNPFDLMVTDGNAIGLGACDIKGGAAALIAAANASHGDCGLLFSTDEEANDPRCVHGFLAGTHGYSEVIVTEPTRCRAVLAHRGIASALVHFHGDAGHASASMPRSALHAAIRWGGRALEHVESLANERFGDLAGLRFNIGRIEGGIKANVVAPGAELRFGFRPLPSQSSDALLADFKAMADADSLLSFERTFHGDPLPAGGGAVAASRNDAARELAQSLQLEIAPAVDFWTEAALFSAAGLTALVYGPGDIAQAHSADEWVRLSELHEAVQTYRRVIDRKVGDRRGIA
jgi:acetylornithine deacetylase